MVAELAPIAPRRVAIGPMGDGLDWVALGERLRVLGWNVDKFDPSPRVVASETIKDVGPKTELPAFDGFALVILVVAPPRPEHATNWVSSALHVTGMVRGKMGPEHLLVLVEDGFDDFTDKGVADIIYPKGNIAERFPALDERLKAVPPAPKPLAPTPWLERFGFDLGMPPVGWAFLGLAAVFLTALATLFSLLAITGDDGPDQRVVSDGVDAAGQAGDGVTETSDAGTSGGTGTTAAAGNGGNGAPADTTGTGLGTGTGTGTDTGTGTSAEDGVGTGTDVGTGASSDDGTGGTGDGSVGGSGNGSGDGSGDGTGGSSGGGGSAAGTDTSADGEGLSADGDPIGGLPSNCTIETPKDQQLPEVIDCDPLGGLRASGPFRTWHNEISEVSVAPGVVGSVHIERRSPTSGQTIVTLDPVNNQSLEQYDSLFGVDLVVLEFSANGQQVVFHQNPARGGAEMVFTFLVDL